MKKLLYIISILLVASVAYATTAIYDNWFTSAEIGEETTPQTVDRVLMYDSTGTDVDYLQLGNLHNGLNSVVVLEADVDDTPVDSATTDPISSNWAFDHDADTDAHHNQAHTMISASDHSGGNDKIFYSGNAGAINEVALGSANQIPTSNGATSAPTFENPVKSGSTLEASPTTWQWFVHDKTNRSYLMQYNGDTSAWSSHEMFGVTNVYVDINNGTDGQEYGDGTTTNAYDTIQYSLDEAPKFGNATADLTVNVAAGTYSTVDISGFEYDVTIEGTMSAVSPTTGTASGTATSAAAYSGGAAAHTKAYLIDTGNTFTTDDSNIEKKLLVITGGTGSGQERIIYHVQGGGTDRLDIVGNWDTTPDATSTYEIRDWDTVIDCNSSGEGVELNNQKNVTLRYLKILDPGTYGVQIDKNSSCTIESCKIEDTVVNNTNKVHLVGVFGYSSLTNMTNCYLGFHSGAAGNTRGINLTQGSSFDPNQIQNVWANEAGVNLYVAHAMASFHNSLIENASFWGVFVNDYGVVQFLDPEDATNTGNVVIDSTTFDGIRIRATAKVKMWKGCHIDNSGRDGIRIEGLSKFTNSSAANDRISNYTGWGVNTMTGSYGDAVSTITYGGGGSGTYTADANSFNN